MKPYEPIFFHFLILSLFFFLSVSSIRADTEAKCGLWIHVELIHLRWSLFPRWLSGDVSKYFPLSEWDFSWDIRFYHEKRDRIFSSGGPLHKKISSLARKSHVSCFRHESHKSDETWYFLVGHEMSNETGDRRFYLTLSQRLI